MERKTILHAEDDERIRDLVRRVVGKYFRDYDVDSLKDGKEAMERLERNSNDLALVLLDNNMGEIHGSEVSLLYAHKPELKEVPFVLFSGDDSYIEDISRLVGARDYIPKPLNAFQLRNRLSKHLS